MQFTKNYCAILLKWKHYARYAMIYRTILIYLTALTTRQLFEIRRRIELLLLKRMEQKQ